MSLQCGIIGLPNAGKSTIFNALTASQVPAESYPFCTIDPNVGVVPVPDERLEQLARIYQPGKVTPATVKFLDIAGLVRGASKGEGLGNQFLAHIREVDALIHVVRCFEDPDVSHVEGSLDPVKDAGTIETELLLKDLETLEKRLARIKKLAASGDSEAREELAALEKVRQELNEGRLACALDLSDEELALLRSLFLLTLKPILYVANVGEGEMEQEERSPQVQALFDFATRENNRAIRLCGKLEQEITLLGESEREAFVEEYHLREAGLTKLIHAAYGLLDYQTFFTCNPNEARAWTFHQGATAWDAAGMVHTDFQRGFIKAEVFHYDELLRLGSEKALKEAGLAGLEGKDYRIRDGDVIYFKSST
ncbi:MAG: redox-regulated ATPase YchF [Fidelibacterota bacterium]|nr:MAG: redox-regulated ATPase YchF [Candidatus Neomarinimicrobiota bacterium]